MYSDVYHLHRQIARREQAENRRIARHYGPIQAKPAPAPVPPAPVAEPKEKKPLAA